MKRALAAAVFMVVLAAAASAVLASTSTTSKPGDYVLVGADNQPPAPLTTSTNRFKTPDECYAAAAKLTPATYKCNHSIQVTVTATCADERAPKLYLTQVTNPEDGKLYWPIPSDGFDLAPGSDVDYVEMASLFVKNAAWPAGYPNCWIRGRAPRSEWRFNAKDEPGKAFMERLEPGMVAEDQHPDEAEPLVAGCCWSSELEATWQSDGSQAARHLAHVYYDGDTLP